MSKEEGSDNYYKMFQNLVELGAENIEKGYLLAVEAEKFYYLKEYKKSAIKFEQAFSYIPNEIPYYENAANSYMKLGNNTRAIEILEELIINLNPISGKAEYLLAILYVDEGQKKKGCDYLSISISKGFNVPEIVQRSLCKPQ